jgi:ATP-binding cassette, subfamily C, bacteriocin exporter
MELKKVKKNFIFQQGQSDCGVACLLSLIKFYGGHTTLEHLRNSSGTSINGTTLLGLYQAANKLGFNSQGCEADIASLISHKEPLILHVLINNRQNHYVICYGFENDKFLIGDPARGINYLSINELEQIWIEKKCLTLTPTDRFITSEEVRKSKLKFLINLIKSDAPVLNISILLGIAISILGMIMSIFSQKLVDNILPENNSSKIITGIILVTFLLIIRVAFLALRQHLLIRQSKDFNNRIIKIFYGSLMYLPKSFFDTRKIGELVARMNDTGRIQRVVSQIVGNIIIDGLMVVTSLVFLFTYSWQAGMIALFSLPVYFGLIFRFNKRIIKAQQKLMESYAHSEGNFINTLQAVSVVKNFNKQEIFTKINEGIYGDLQEKNFFLGKINVKLTMVSGVAGVFFMASILSMGVYQTYGKNLSVGELMAIIGIASSLLPSIGNIALVFIPINEAKIAFERMYEFVTIGPEENSPLTPIAFVSLKLENIAFRFPGRKQILTNVDIEIRKNEAIAIIGESGSGKSTISQMLQLFYQPESGSMFLNENTKLEEIPVNSWRDILGVVPQDIHLFNGTIIDNICLNQGEEQYEKVIEFCKKYDFHPFINQLPNGYNTLVGEEGVKLSGGQKQIIALARAIYSEPQLLLLDEATSALDRNTENFVLELLSNLKKEMGIIFITHRIHTIRQLCERIYIIENGETIAKGAHNEIMCSQNIYSDFWNSIQLADVE